MPSIGRNYTLRSLLRPFSSFKDSRLVFPPHGDHWATVSSYPRSCWPARDICDVDAYSNKSWSIVAQGMFQLREITQMEKEACQYLERELNVDPTTLKEFKEMVRKDFAGPGSYPTCILPLTKKSTTPSSDTPSFAPTCGLIPSLSNEQRYSPPNVHYMATILPTFSSSPETPSPTYSITSPPAFCVPPTSAGIEDLSAYRLPHRRSARRKKPYIVYSAIIDLGGEGPVTHDH